MSEQLNVSGIKWSASKKFFFLFLMCYTILYIFPFPFDTIPHSEFIFDRYTKVVDIFISWIGKHVLHINRFSKPQFSDSGDTQFEYVKCIVFAFLSLVFTLITNLIYRERNEYEKLRYCLFVYIRYCIGFYMIIYGFDKLFKSHFSFPDLIKLDQTLGNFSPQGLLWAFMGYSKSYNLFLGLIEILSGALLLFRRTTIFGAFLVFAVMINVVFLNFSYDVPVKLFALHIVFYAIILLYPNLKTLFNFFFLNKTIALSEIALPAFPGWFASYRKTVKSIVIIGFVILFMSFSINNMNETGDAAPKPQLYGIYNIELFVSDNDTLPPLTTNSMRWNKLIIDKRITAIKGMTDQLTYFTAQTDTVLKIISFRSNRDTTKITQFHYETDLDKLILKGKVNEKDSVYVKLKKVDLKTLPLINREFHWIEEYPVNY